MGQLPRLALAMELAERQANGLPELVRHRMPSLSVGRNALLVLRLVVLGAALAGCSGNGTNDSKAPSDAGVRIIIETPDATLSNGLDPTGQSTESVEWVSFHTVIPFNASDFHALASGLFGPAAQSGSFITNREVSPGIFLTSIADPTTPEQTRISLTFNDGTVAPRTLALVPASFDVGNIFVTTIDAAIATMQAEEAASPGSSESYLLQYQVSSPKGGTFSFGVQGQTGTFSLVLDVASPTTNLAVSKIGTPAYSTTPYDSILGTVYFHFTQDDFDYFVQHAYGTAAAVGANFQNFELVPHTWLRLTVTPHLEQKYVNVAFAVQPLSGSQVPVASAPASVLAGATFQTLVDHNMSTMTAQETAKPGSSSPFSIPFYYDDPNGGGVVQVIVVGTAGVFVVDYAVESPRHTLTDVPFNPYKPVVFNPPDAAATAACDKLGNPGIVLAPSGAFDITFSASSVLTNAAATTPLVGDIYCSTYNAADVTVSGPNPDAGALQNFVVPNASLQPDASPPHYTTGSLPDGQYQILCGQDLHHNGQIGYGDPVTLPISPLTIACNLNPVGVQFALLDPQQ
jgi:hypothetical protein